MNLNKFSEMTLEELRTVIEIAQKEISKRCYRSNIGHPVQFLLEAISGNKIPMKGKIADYLEKEDLYLVEIKNSIGELYYFRVRPDDVTAYKE